MALSYRSGQTLGFSNLSNTSVNTTNLNAAANWFAVSFVPTSALTLSEARLFVSALTGTLGASDVLADLYDATGAGGAPGSSIETGKSPSSTITAAGWYTFTGFTTVLTANQQYWIVLRNVNGTPASNFPTIRVLGTSNTVLQGNSAAWMAWTRATSTNSGSTWSVSTPTYSGYRIGYTAGYDGVPISNVGNAAVGDGVYSSRESGSVFTTPKLCLLRVSGLSIWSGTKTGSPTGTPRIRLWENQNSTPVLIGTVTLTLGTTVNGWANGIFDGGSTLTVRPNTTYRITLGETTQSDASGNRYNATEITWDSDSNSTILLPFNGTMKKTYYDGSSWTDTAGSLIPCALLLDTSQEFYGSTHATYQLGVM